MNFISTKYPYVFFAILSMISPRAFADNYIDIKEHREFTQNLRDTILKNNVLGDSPPIGGDGANEPTTELRCGDTVTSSMALANDLHCPATTGFVLRIVGNNIKFNGNGHKITAPNAAAGVFTQGNSIHVTGIKVNGIRQGHGILAYDSPGIKISGNNFSWNLIGILLYSDVKESNHAWISHNTAVSNGLFGIRTEFDLPGNIDQPHIKENNFSNSGSYAMLVNAKSYELTGSDNNNFSGSASGIYLAKGDFYVHDLSLAYSRIQKVGIFVDSAPKTYLWNVDVSNTMPAEPSQERVGLDLYRSGLFEIAGLTATRNDVGIRMETALGSKPSGIITLSRFSSNILAGIYVSALDDSQYGCLNFFLNRFHEPAGVHDILIGPGIEIGTDSSIQPNSDK